MRTIVKISLFRTRDLRICVCAKAAIVADTFAVEGPALNLSAGWHLSF